MSIVETPSKPRPIMNGIETGVPFSKDNQPSGILKSEGWAKAIALKDLRKYMFEKMYKMGTFDKALTKVDEKVDSGELRDFMTMTGMILPREVDIKADVKMTGIDVKEVNQERIQELLNSAKSESGL